MIVEQFIGEWIDPDWNAGDYIISMVDGNLHVRYFQPAWDRDIEVKNIEFHDGILSFDIENTTEDWSMGEDGQILVTETSRWKYARVGESSTHPLIGIWRNRSGYYADHTCTISRDEGWHVSIVCDDGETIQISNLRFDAGSLLFETLTPSCGGDNR